MAHKTSCRNVVCIEHTASVEFYFFGGSFAVWRKEWFYRVKNCIIVLYCIYIFSTHKLLYSFQNLCFGLIIGIFLKLRTLYPWYSYNSFKQKSVECWSIADECKWACCLSVHNIALLFSFTARPLVVLKFDNKN